MSVQARIIHQLRQAHPELRTITLARAKTGTRALAWDESGRQRVFLQHGDSVVEVTPDRPSTGQG